MSQQQDRARAFASLHVAGKPLVLFNAWDPGSARTVANAGARAIATGSFSVAYAHGFDDGERTPLPLVLDNARRIVAAVDLPVTLDFESAYGATPEDAAANFAAALATGVIGCNFEDGIVGTAGGVYAIEAQALRIRALRTAAEASGIPAFINARTDLFLNAPPEKHDAAMVADAIARGQAYAKAGASGYFVPGLIDEAFIAQVCREVKVPINVMASPATPPKSRLAELGVARISYGPGPYRVAMKALGAAAREAMA